MKSIIRCLVVTLVVGLGSAGAQPAGSTQPAGSAAQPTAGATDPAAPAPAAKPADPARAAGAAPAGAQAAPPAQPAGAAGVAWYDKLANKHIEEDGTFWMPKSVNLAADDSDLMFYAVLALSAFFFIAIMIAVIYLVWKYRHRPGHKAEPSAGQ